MLLMKEITRRRCIPSRKWSGGVYVARAVAAAGSGEDDDRGRTFVEGQLTPGQDYHGIVVRHEAA